MDFNKTQENIQLNPEILNLRMKILEQNIEELKRDYLGKFINRKDFYQQFEEQSINLERYKRLLKRYGNN